MPKAPPVSNQFALALSTARAATRKSQESFDVVSSRTYVSSLERGMKSPTLNKVDELASVFGIHPLTLLTLAYATSREGLSVPLLFQQISDDLFQLQIHQPNKHL